MKSLSSLGIGLSLVFGCLLLALVAEIYYLLWKKRLIHSDIEGGGGGGGGYSSHGSNKDPICLFCWEKPSSLSSTALNPQEICSEESSKDHILLKPIDGDESIEAELMRLHNLTGPPRFLFTIKEETKEDLESEDGKPRSLAGTPFLTPLSSPPFFTPPHTPLDCYNKQHGLNPLFESSRQDELVRIRSSPPPKFKFLRDAEDKLYKKTLMEEALRADRACATVAKNSADLPDPVNLEEEEGSFITFLIGKNREKVQHHQHHSNSSQVLPLPSSPSKIRRTSHGKLII